MSARPNNLPVQSTSFVGREEQLQHVQQLLSGARLLTLTGAGGCGKTRLALRLAADVCDAYADGVWFIDLAALADAALVAGAVAEAMGVPEVPGGAVLDTLVEHLRARVSLLVLDNCEHVIAEAAGVADVLLRTCPGVRILASSREPLRSAGETTWRVPSLRLPPPAGVGMTVDDLLRFEAVRLFVDRAQAARPDFDLTPANSTAVQEICHRLDGIPLALELAAARVRAFSVEQLAARLGDRFRLLTAGPRTAMPRQQTLQATVDWSYALLSEPERAVLRRLAVFAGGWTLEAAEVVAAAGGIPADAVLDLLAALVDKSLVLADQHRGAMRYGLLETIRQYARERLEDADEVEATRDRHLTCFLMLAEQAEPHLRGSEARSALDRVADELDNFRVALEWALRTRPEAALRLAGTLGWFWWARDHHSEGRRWLARALAASPEASRARMRALHAAGWLAHHQRDLRDARTLLDESLAIARQLPDRWTEAWAMHCLGRVAYFENDAATARRLAEQSLSVANEVGDSWLIAWAYHLLGLAAYIAGDDATARACYEHGLEIRRELRFDEGVGILLILLGLVATRQGRLAEARGLYREGLTTVRDVLGPWGVAMPLAALSHIGAASGQPVRAVRLAAAATRLGQTYQTPLIPLVEPLLARGLDLARLALSQTAYALAWAEGQAMSLDTAVAEALAVDLGSATTNDVLSNLTPTQRQVLRLLVAGKTTKEIASELVVAVSTVDRHLTHIYTRLGARNRAEATAIALKHALVE